MAKIRQGNAVAQGPNWQIRGPMRGEDEGMQEGEEEEGIRPAKGQVQGDGAAKRASAPPKARCRATELHPRRI
jgi:hypothetical protein